MRIRREINVFSVSFLDLISGALGAVIILYVAVPKKNTLEKLPTNVVTQNTPKTLAEQTQLIDQLTTKIALLELELEKKQDANAKNEEAKNFEVGFKFKGKNIVFLIDTSKSMLDEDRMGQVKAGLKMLIKSMPPQYAIDIIQFPNGMRTPFRPLFTELKPLGIETRSQTVDFIYDLKPLGATPTRNVLQYVFDQYPSVTDIVLLTDGEPSEHNSQLKDDIYDILAMVRNFNKDRKIQINTIGVGQEVLHDKTSKPYQFLRLLAEENDGFFIGF
jgi:hypothetical protein